jgi:anti-sigma B factor antagonist
MALTVTTRTHGDHVVVAVIGDLDLVTAPELTAEVMTAIDGGARNVVIDAAGLDFCDSSGLSAFARIANRIEPDGRLAVADPRPIVRRVLEVSGLVEVFLVADTVDGAIAALA